MRYLVLFFIRESKKSDGMLNIKIWKCRYCVPMHTGPLQALVTPNIDYVIIPKIHNQHGSSAFKLTHFVQWTLFVQCLPNFCVHCIGTLWIGTQLNRASVLLKSMLSRSGRDLLFLISLWAVARISVFAWWAI